MTTKVRIQNYQSIKDASFKVEGFTVILGKNNIGKSAVIRAIEAPLANQPGKSFIRHGEKNTTVNITRDDIDIEWVKGASATYTITAGGEKGVFTKLNRDVPQPILDAGFGKMEVGDRKVFPSIASQFDELFLVDKPGTVVTEVLASLYNIDVISKADDLCQKALRSQKSMLKTREEDLVITQKKLEVFADFENIKSTVEKLVEMDEKSESLSSEILTLKEYEAAVIGLMETLTLLKTVTTIEIPDKSACKEALGNLQWLRETESKYQELSKNVDRLKAVPKLKIPKKSEIDALTNEVESLQWLKENEEKFNELYNNVTKLKAVSKLKIPDTKDTEALVTEVSTLQKWEDGVFRLADKIKQQKKFLSHFNMDEITESKDKAYKALEEYEAVKILEESFLETATNTKETQNQIKDVTKALDDKKKELAEMKVCPLCERPI